VAHTCIFGWISFYFLLNLSVWDSIASHVICNSVGLPNIRTNHPRVVACVYSAGLAGFLVSL
jgi:hypothetical protein